jgi:hypothetical protein
LFVTEFHLFSTSSPALAANSLLKMRASRRT